MHALRLAAALAVAFLLTACGSSDRERIDLLPEHQAAAEAELYPVFRLIQVDVQAPSAPFDALLDEALAPLQASLPEGARVSLWTTGEADADAGCLAGGQLFVTQGLLAWVEHRDELSAALAAALSLCPTARMAWESRSSAQLAPVSGEHPLLQRYRDYRLPANAALFAQLMNRTCGAGACYDAAVARLQAAGLEADGLNRLGRRIVEQWPESAWLDRLGASEFAAAAEADDDLSELFGELQAKREGLGALAAVKRTMYAGNLSEAYQNVLRARRALDNEFEAEIVFSELSLLNYHPDSAERSFERVRAMGRELPQSDYLLGVQAAQKRARATGQQYLEASLETLPRLSAHFQLGILLHRAWETDAALPHYRIVAAAEPGHPSAAPAASYIAQIEGQ